MDSYTTTELQRNVKQIMDRCQIDGQVCQITRNNDVIGYLIPVDGYVVLADSTRGTPQAPAATAGDIAAELGVTLAAVAGLVTMLIEDPEWGRARTVLRMHDEWSRTLIHRDAAVEIARRLTQDNA